MDDILRVTLPTAVDFDMLEMRIKGRIVIPQHVDYDAFRALSLGNWDHRPAVIVCVLDAEDVAAALRFAQLNDLEVAVRSGGHSVGGYGSAPGGMVIDMREIDMIDIATDRASAWVGTGLTAGEVTMTIEKQNLIIGFGDASTVGVGGLTLGGGVGYLVRKYGLTIDNLLAVEIVTAAGKVLIADSDNHADLFWALRGGGGNFGVVTRFKYKLHEMPSFTAGPLVLPATPEVIAGFFAAAEAATEDLTPIVMVMPAPPMPFLPPEIHGKTVLLAMMAFNGPLEEANKALAPFRALATPIADLVGPAPLSSLYLPEDPDPKPAVSIRSQFIEGIDVAAAEKMLALLGECPARMHMAQIRVLGGAAARVEDNATAYAHRKARIMLSFLTLDAPINLKRNEAWVSKCLSRMKTSAPGVYVNFVAREGRDRLHDAYPEKTWNRLRQVKRHYDPGNVFHLNQNIPPAELA
jgi:hypothetical protein